MKEIRVDATSGKDEQKHWPDVARSGGQWPDELAFERTRPEVLHCCERLPEPDDPWPMRVVPRNLKL